MILKVVAYYNSFDATHEPVVLRESIHLFDSTIDGHGTF